MSNNSVSIIQFGAIPADVMLDEAEFSVKTMSRKASRTKKVYKNAKGATNGLRFIDPMLVFSFTGVPGDASGFAVQHPGTSVTSLLNFAAPARGFDPTAGVLVFEDPEDSYSQEDPVEVKFDVAQYSFVSGPAVEIV